ncbi:MAG: fibronectin type III domain-containing protein [Clostridia bacterium]|nr:fibronectin type III domain-containing protein [Clostridia bacterium]
MKKITALFMVVIMVLSAVPMSGFVSFAAGSSFEENFNFLNDENIVLGRGFNFLEDKTLRKGNLEPGTIIHSLEGFNGEDKINANYMNGGGLEYSYEYVKDASSYMHNKAYSLAIDADLSVQYSIFSAEADFSYNLSESSSESESKSKEYISFNVEATKQKYYFNNITEETKETLWKSGSISQEFRSALGKITDDESIEKFFQQFGTHILTSYETGGNAQLIYSSSSFSEAATSSFSEDISVSVGVDVDGICDVHGSFDQHKDESSSSSSSSEKANCYARTNTVHGCPFVVKDNETQPLKDQIDAVNEWNTKLDDPKTTEIVINENLDFLPVWELLVEEKDAETRARLEEYYNEKIQEKYKYDNYFYTATTQEYKKGYTYIRTAEDLIGVSNNLSGKYVLLCDIDLSDYDNWEPIGLTKKSAFRGTFDGNGNEISGLKITSVDGASAGLFGYNQGLISDLTVSGEIDIDMSGKQDNLAYVGGIVGYNEGRIQNCRNRVIIDGETEIKGKEEASVTDSWFDSAENKSDISSALSGTVEAAEVSDSITYEIKNSVLKLTGSAKDVTITVARSAEPTAYIVLEDADITGSIVCDIERDVCIISTGKSNSFTGTQGNIAVDVGDSNLYVTGDAPLTVTGGRGADGVDGTTGTWDGTGANPPDRASAGTAGTAGQNGHFAFVAKELHTNLDSTIAFVGGSGGNGGNGADGKKGGTGNYPGSGGHAGHGGKGGRGESPAKEAEVALFTYDEAILIMESGEGGAGGNGGNGGNGGKNTWTFISCNQTSGGNAGNGGDGGSTMQPYETNENNAFASDSSIIISRCGDTGNYGEKGTAGKKGEVSTNISGAGSNGKAGSDGSAGIILAPSENGSEVYEEHAGSISELLTKDKKYHLHDENVNFEQASSGNTLVSITTAEEQALIDKLIEPFDYPGYWIGLKRKATSGADYNKFVWTDGNIIKSEGTGDGAVVSRVDNNGKVLSSGFANWAEGEPNDSGGEDYVHLTPEGEWNDNIGTVTGPYITETTLTEREDKVTDKNALAVGGISGFNGKTAKIRNCINSAEILIGAKSEDETVSAYGGGISGINKGSIAGCINSGEICGEVQSESVVNYANAYAENIATVTDSGIIRHCKGNAVPETQVISLGGLVYSNTTDADEEIRKAGFGVIGGDPQDVLDRLWKNDSLRIKAVDKIEYFASEKFDVNSLHAVSVSDGDVDENPQLYVNYNFRKDATTANVAIICGNVSRTVPVKLIPVMPSKLSIVNAKTEYHLGDSFSGNGMVVKLTNNDGTEEQLTWGDKRLSTSSPNMNTSGTKTVTVYYSDGTNSISCSYDINVICQHVYSRYISNNDATCLENGTKYAFCDNNCGHKNIIIDIGSRLEHVFSNYRPNGDATCAKDGTKTAQCDYGCGTEKTMIDIGSIKPHSFTNFTSNGNADCTKDGTKTARCDYGCGLTKTETDYGSMKEHSFTRFVSNGDATCTEDGTKTARCDYGCGAKKTVIDEGSATGHSFRRYVSNNDETCTEDGTKTASCSNGCGAKDTVIDEGTATGHSFRKYVSDDNATCTEDGTKTAKCNNGCGAKDTVTEEDTATGHSFIRYISDGNATCTEDGTKTAKCSNGCGKKNTVTDINSAIGHSYTRYTSNGDATCAKDGTKTAKCDNGCGKRNTVIDSGTRKAHVSDSGTVTKAATYTSTGTKIYKCIGCKTTLRTENLAKLNLGKVSGLKASSETDKSVKLKWNKVDGAQKYTVYYSTDGKKWKTASTSKTSVTVKKLKSGQTYRFKVKAVAGDTAGAESSVIKAVTKVAKVSLKSLKSAKTGQLTVTWAKTSGASGYQVEYSTSKKFTKKTTKTTLIKKSKTVKTTLKKLKKGKKYYVRVKAYKTVSGKKVFGAYSTVKNVKVK